MQISFCFCKICICLKILENIQISVNMIYRFNITDEYSVKCDFILNTAILSTQHQIFHWENFENVMFYDFVYLAKGFRMRPKVRSTLSVTEKSNIYDISFPQASISKNNSVSLNQLKGLLPWQQVKTRGLLEWTISFFCCPRRLQYTAEPFSAAQDQAKCDSAAQVLQNIHENLIFRTCTLFDC